MFDRFWRGDSATQHAGAGLGLAIARGLVEAQGGTHLGRAARNGRRAGVFHPSARRHLTAPAATLVKASAR